MTKSRSAISFITAVNNRSLLGKNLLASPALQEGWPHEILIQEGYPSAARAYNQAIDRCKNDLLIFLHQDMYLPSGWLSRVEFCIANLERKDPNWGVVGCWGAAPGGELTGHIYSTGLNVLGTRFDEPKEAQTLDEIVLVVRKSVGLRFDEELPHFHFYGTDLCLTARARGMRSYVMSAFCIHNSNYLGVLPPEFYECYRYVKRKWQAYLPIYTSCICVSRFDSELRKRRVKELYATLCGNTVRRPRLEDPSRAAYMTCEHCAG